MNSWRSLGALVLAAFTITAAPATAHPPMTVTSTAMPDGSTVAPAQLLSLCGGRDRSPDLHWSGATTTVAGYAVTMFDPDAPAGGVWHWIGVPVVIAENTTDMV